MMFVIIMLVLFVGVVVGCICFKFLLIFIIFWLFFIYYLMVYMVWDNGLLVKFGVIDFVGGIVVYINVGIIVLVLLVFLGVCYKYGKDMI